MNVVQQRGTGISERLALWCVHNRVVVGCLALALLVGGLVVMPFRTGDVGLPRDPISVDALPDITDNQQIVFARWEGRSPQDVSDQVTYPLSVALLGAPGVRSIRTTSMFGFSSINVVFDDGVDFFWSRSRILEKLASLPAGALPDGVVPNLGPEATGLGQIYWYTLEAQDEEGRAVGDAYSLDELRALQDWNVKYALQGVQGVAEVASVGGYVREYQVVVDRDAMRAHGVSLGEIVNAVRDANKDVGARTMEINGVEYVIRGLGRIRSVEDLEIAVVSAHEAHTPVRVRDVAKVQIGPALRRGALDDGGAEVVGGVVTARYGANPMVVIERVRERIEAITTGLPKKVLADGREVAVAIVPFYDRARLIDETLATLSGALHHELLITVLVVLLLLGHLKTAALVSMVLPLSVASTLICMRVSGIGADVMALSGIAIAIGTMVDVSIVFAENIRAHLGRASVGQATDRVIARAVGEVAPAVVTATATTVLSFLPIFGLTGQEGKMFAPLATTKTLALASAGVVTLLVIPAIAALLAGATVQGGPRGHAPFKLRVWLRQHLFDLLIGVVAAAWFFSGGGGPAVLWCGAALLRLTRAWLPDRTWRVTLAGRERQISADDGAVWVGNTVAMSSVVWVLAAAWAPLGIGASLLSHIFFVALTTLGVAVVLLAFGRSYAVLLEAALRFRFLFLMLNVLVVLLGVAAWLGAPRLTASLPSGARESALVRDLESLFPGLQEDFVPPFDEGSLLYMPSTTSNASIGTSLELMQLADAAIASLPEVRRAVGKLGRAETSLDPAPVSMVETIVEIEPEFRLDRNGRVERFAYDESSESFARDDFGALIPDPDGRPFRTWRPEVKDMEDLWAEIVRVSRVPGLSGVSKLQPIETRIIMLQTGMRSVAGIKVFGPTLEDIETFSKSVERRLRRSPAVAADTVLVDRVVGKPYLELEIDRAEIGRHGLSIRAVQDTIEAAIGGKAPTSTIEGRERYSVRVRYPREARDNVEAIGGILVTGHRGEQVPLRQLAKIRYARGPQMIRSEDTFLVGYVTFDPAPGRTAVEAVRELDEELRQAVDMGVLEVPDGVSYRFAGSYESQLRSAAKLKLLVPLALGTIFVLLYMQFRRASTALIVFSGVVLSAAGGMLTLWVWARPELLASWIPGVLLNALQLQEVAITVTVWVGFLALFGIATDNGVILATYLDQYFAEHPPRTRGELLRGLVAAGQRRVRPCLMTTATTILALLPIITSTGRGADLMIPMALPLLGGAGMSLLTLLTVPVLYGYFIAHGDEGRDRMEETPSKNAADES